MISFEKYKTDYCSSSKFLWGSTLIVMILIGLTLNGCDSPSIHEKKIENATNEIFNEFSAVSQVFIFQSDTLIIL